jgi:SAM-dependent methyltransferase
MPNTVIVVPESVQVVAKNSVGEFFARVSQMPADVSARDHLDLERPIRAGRLLAQYTPMQGKKLLEIGSGFGINLATWIKLYGLDGYGTERDAVGFSSSFRASRELFSANQLDPERIIGVAGDMLPFADAKFDIVYAGNVLEHTENPLRVMEEAVRVLRPGGILHAEIPNYLSYFEGHYMVPQPPLVFRWMLPLWVRLLGRDPSFARTMRTEINPVWCRRAIGQINQKYPVELLSLGEDEFLKRLARPFEFDMERTARALTGIIRIVQILNIRNWIGRLIVLAQGHYPIYLTVRRKANMGN